MDSIKIGRNAIPIQKGDYIMYNGSCYQFLTGNRRQLYYKNHTSYWYITIPASIIKTIKFKDLKCDNNEKGLIKWYF